MVAPSRMKLVLGGNDGAQNGTGGDNGPGASGLVAHFLHHGQQKTAQSGGLAHGTAHETRENDAGHHSRIAQAAAHPADHQLGQLHHAFGKSARGHDFTGKDKEGDGHQRERIDSGISFAAR